MTRNEWEQIVLQETVDQRLEWRAQGGFRLASTWSPPPFTRPGARGNPLTIHPVASNLKLVIENVWQVGRYNLQFRFSVSTVLVVVRLRNRHAIKCNSPTFICSKHQTRANRLVSLPVLIFSLLFIVSLFKSTSLSSVKKGFSIWGSVCMYISISSDKWHQLMLNLNSLFWVTIFF